MRVITLSFLSILLACSACQHQAGYRRVANGITVNTAKGTLGLFPLAGNAVRVKYLTDTLPALPELVFESATASPQFNVEETSATITLSSSNIQVMFDKETASLSFADAAGNALLSETAGTRRLIADSLRGEPCYLAQQSFNSPANESIFGLGQFQDGHFNLKGISRRLTQVNSQIALPFIYSSKGYGLLWHQYGLTDFNPADNIINLKKEEQSTGNNTVAEVTGTAGTQQVPQNQSLYLGEFTVPTGGDYSIFLDLGGMGNRHYVVIDGHPIIDQDNMWLPPTAGARIALAAGKHQVQLVCKADNEPRLSWKQVDNTTTLRSPHAQQLDYVVFAGTADEVIKSYRGLSGNAPLLPKWAYGFWQCRERYTSGHQLVGTVKEFRNRQLPLDAIVQDWQYWGSRGWGVPQFDETNYPDPAGFIAQLHQLNAHFNISIWSNPDKNSQLGKTYVANERFIPGTKWLDYFNPATRNDYWATLKTNMFDNGVDSWWMDAVEPENDALVGTQTHLGAGEFYRLVYPLMVSQAVYEGQRATTDQKRVCILTRSAFLGQQRYGIINWSGDIGGTWDSYRRQVVAGLNYCITGMPYWTTDIGGFFRPGNAQYTDPHYHELLLRWFQWGVFNPIFRVHGYMSETEPWKYGPAVEDRMRRMLNLRYQLLPYIYSQAWQVTNGYTLMRPLVMDFAADEQAINQPYQYMFGKALMVAPITRPGANSREVYLPKCAGWFNFWTNEPLHAGQTVNAEAPLDRIPLFVKAGSILPYGPKQQYADEQPLDSLEVRVYAGANGQFLLYEDEGDNYNYEKGQHSLIDFVWDDAGQTLSINARQGAYPGMLTERTFNIVLIGGPSGAQTERKRAVSYTGSPIVVSLN